ncbi:MAG: hypothetical protein ACOC2W_01640 [bacterium]
MKNSNDNNGLKNTATIDVKYYNELIEKKRLFDEYVDDKSIAFKESWNRFNTDYKVLTNDETVKELGSIFNKRLENSIDVQMYDELKHDYYKLKNEYDDLEKECVSYSNKLKSYEKSFNVLKNMSTKKFKEWRKNYSNK